MQIVVYLDETNVELVEDLAQAMEDQQVLIYTDDVSIATTETLNKGFEVVLIKDGDFIVLSEEVHMGTIDSGSDVASMIADGTLTFLESELISHKYGYGVFTIQTASGNYTISESDREVALMRVAEADISNGGDGVATGITVEWLQYSTEDSTFEVKYILTFNPSEI